MIIESLRPYTMSGGGSAHGAIAGRIRPDGLLFRNDRGRFRPLFVSGLSLPSKILLDRPAAIAFLDWAARYFNGVRTMAGDLGWANQTPALALEGLPILLDECRRRDLHVAVDALTGTRDALPDPRTHCRRVGEILAPTDHTWGNVANEPYHATQSDDVHDFENLDRWGRESFESQGIAWACGAPEGDEPDPATLRIGGSAIWIHLGRGRDLWNMVRHMRELRAVAENYRKAVWNGEPIGWDERGENGRRCDRPEIAFTMGALSRGFELALVSHAQHGLRADLPGPIQQQCHEEVVAGFNVFGTDDDLVFFNTGWAGSPILKANFGDEEGRGGTVVRTYSFLDRSNHGWTAVIGETGDPKIQFRPGWTVVGETATRGALPAEGGIGRIRILEVAS